MPNEPKTPCMAVTLREPQLDDIARLYEFQCDPESNRLAGVYPRSRDAFDAIWTKVLTEGHIASRVILADGVLVGQINRFPRNELDYVGYWLDRSHWGRGIATRALRQFLGIVWQRPLHAQVAAHNVASIRVLRGCGFVEVGREFSPGDERFVACEEVQFLLA